MKESRSIKRWITVWYVVAIIGWSAFSWSIFRGPLAGAEAQIGIGVIEYRYDAVHDVSIWTYRSSNGAGMAVLPGEKVKDKAAAMIDGVQ